MNIKEMLDMGYYALIALAIIAYSGIKLYSLHHTIKNKWIAQIPDLATAFVHEAETTGGDGTKKMDIVITSVCNILRDHKINITPDIEAAVKAYAEKEVAKLNQNKPVEAESIEAQSVDDFDEDTVVDMVKGTAGADKDA